MTNIKITPCPIYQGLEDFWQAEKIPVLQHRVNLVTNWNDTDTEENFLKNPKPNYTQDSIIYKFNSHGFRSKEFEVDSTKPSILCLGCNITEGVGVNYEDTWIAHIEKAFPDYNVYNLGISGSSGDTVARLLTAFGNILNTKLIFVLWPHITSYEQYDTGAVINMRPNNGIENHYPAEHTRTHFFNNRQKNRTIVKLLSKINQYQVFEEYYDSVIHQGDWRNKIIDTGRDNHPGPQWHQAMADIFLKKYYDNTTI